MGSTDSWRTVGQIQCEGDQIKLPAITNESGLYRLRFNDGSYYIGETGTLNDRLGAYHTPGQGVEAEFRIQRAIRSHSPVRVEIMTGAQFITRSQRCTQESRIIREMRADGEKLLNGGDIREKIAFCESEIQRLRHRLLTDSDDAVTTC